MHNIKKKYGQNFITDLNLINKITNLISLDSNLIIEIGPGMGALTKVLAKKDKKIIAIEIDKELEDYLQLIDSKNLKIIYDDFLKLNFEDLIKKEDKISFISNTPYYLTTEIIFKIINLSEKFNIKEMVLMTQLEVANRLCAKVNDKKYNALTIITSLYCDKSIKIKVNKKMFNPIPKVDSAVVYFKFINWEEKNLNRVELTDFIKKMFSYKRKTILNNLKKYYDENKIALIKDKINLSLRPENIKIEEYIKIWKILEKT